jgi:hypothetical protein
MVQDAGRAGSSTALLRRHPEDVTVRLDAPLKVFAAHLVEASLFTPSNLCFRHEKENKKGVLGHRNTASGGPYMRGF